MAILDGQTVILYNILFIPALLCASSTSGNSRSVLVVHIPLHVSLSTGHSPYIATQYIQLCHQDQLLMLHTCRSGGVQHLKACLNIGLLSLALAYLLTSRQTSA